MLTQSSTLFPAHSSQSHFMGYVKEDPDVSPDGVVNYFLTSLSSCDPFRYTIGQFRANRFQLLADYAVGDYSRFPLAVVLEPYPGDAVAARDAAMLVRSEYRCAIGDPFDRRFAQIVASSPRIDNLVIFVDATRVADVTSARFKLDTRADPLDEHRGAITERLRATRNLRSKRSVASRLHSRSVTK